MSKGKDHKKYELETKASIAKTRDANILIGALAFEENRYDGHLLPDVFAQIKRILGHVPKIFLGDRGYRGTSKIDNTRIHTMSRSGCG